MKAFKFVVPTGSFLPIPSDPRYAVKGCAAIVFAESRERAIAILDADLKAHNEPPWYEVATLTEIQTDTEGLAIVVQM